MAELLFTLVAYQHVVELTAVAITFVVMLSSIDDVIVDMCFWTHRLYRWFVRARFRPLTVNNLISRPERPIAIMVPAWKEHDVIYSMLRTNSVLLEYRQHHFFVGVYGNDPATASEVRRAMQDFSNVSMVTVPRPGPTSKADCLNEIISAIAVHEREKGIRFEGFALHDSEDVIHPYELKLFNYLLERNDLIQLPVYSFRCGLERLVAGTYMDEFAEAHGKELVVREALTGIVPCAGVSACFSRRAIEALRQEGGEVFRIGSLTEDYDIAFRLREHGMKEIFARFPVRFTIETASTGGRPLLTEKKLPIATREYFPSDFRAAYRQRARWLLGIVFQGWSQHGWRGSLAAKYFFIRDRKGVVTAPLAVLAYLCIGNFVALEMFYRLLPGDLQLYYIMLDTDWYRAMLLANLLFLANRVVHRTYFTTVVYGWAHGAMAGPRMIVSNFLNFFAALRAAKIFLLHKLTGQAIAWDKTQHVYPVGHGHSLNVAVPS